jgi:hypothetical protein
MLLPELLITSDVVDRVSSTLVGIEDELVAMNFPLLLVIGYQISLNLDLMLNYLISPIALIAVAAIACSVALGK